MWKKWNMEHETVSEGWGSFAYVYLMVCRCAYSCGMSHSGLCRNHASVRLAQMDGSFRSPLMPWFVYRGTVGLKICSTALLLCWRERERMWEMICVLVALISSSPYIGHHISQGILPGGFSEKQMSYTSTVCWSMKYGYYHCDTRSHKSDLIAS